MKKMLPLLVIFVLVFSILTSVASETETTMTLEFFVEALDLILTKQYGEGSHMKVIENYQDFLGEIIYTFDIENMFGNGTITLIYRDQKIFWVIPKEELKELKVVIDILMNDIPFGESMALINFMKKL